MPGKIVNNKGKFKITIDQNERLIYGGASILSFNGHFVQESLGVKVKIVSINFTNLEVGDIQ